MTSITVARTKKNFSGFSSSFWVEEEDLFWNESISRATDQAKFLVQTNFGIKTTVETTNSYDMAGKSWKNRGKLWKIFRSCVRSVKCGKDFPQRLSAIKTISPKLFFARKGYFNQLLRNRHEIINLPRPSCLFTPPEAY